MSDHARYAIPPHILDALDAWRDGAHPYPFGDFLTAVLANDFVDAACRADPENALILRDYALYLANELPDRTGDPARDCWGSYEAVANWVTTQRAIYDEVKRRKVEAAP